MSGHEKNGEDEYGSGRGAVIQVVRVVVDTPIALKALKINKIQNSELGDEQRLMTECSGQLNQTLRTLRTRSEKAKRYKIR